MGFVCFLTSVEFLRVLCIFLCKQSLLCLLQMFSPDCGLSSDSLDIVTQQEVLILILSPTHMSLEQEFGVVSDGLVSAIGFP